VRVWANGELLGRPEAAVVSAVDHGFTVGDGVFESVKIVDGRPFALTRHLRRLAGSAAGLGLPEPDEAEVRRGVSAVLADFAPPFGRLRITWTAGPSPMGSGRGTPRPTLVVAAAAGTPPEASTDVVTVPWPRNERSAVAGLKTTSYAENVVALARAHERGASEALFANTAGDVCEGTGTNVFYVLDGDLRTPSLAVGCLAGVTRALVLEWYGAREVDAPIEVLAEASEIFLASTTRDVQPVRRCDGREYPAPGPVTVDVQATWAARSAATDDP
jgi:branched-chain amino acid aminotransferase